GTARLRSRLADLEHELSVLREFEDMTIIIAVATDPDEAFVIDINAVLVLEPIIALAGSAPSLEQIAVGVELHHRRSREAGFGARWGTRPGLLLMGRR